MGRAEELWWRIDRVAFRRFLDGHDLTWKAVSRDTGLTTRTLSRCLADGRISLVNAYKFACAYNLPFSAMFGYDDSGTMNALRAGLGTRDDG